MSDPSQTPDAERNERLLSLMDQWQTLQRQGQVVRPSELCADCPDLASELERAIRLGRQIEANAQRLDVEMPEAVGELAGTMVRPGGPTTPVLPSPSRYQIEEKLGEGGMGAVYRARDQQLARTVALKVIRPDALSLSLRARIQAEAKAVAALDHPHIIKVFDVLEWPSPDWGTSPALALEYVPGGNLAQHLGDRPLTPESTRRLVELLARAVAHAHERGIVHRDLKPDNVLLAPMSEVAALNTPIGCPKVSDFGLARQVTGGQRLTREGAVMGTPLYMAPEQAEGSADVGPPADVWALGVLLYRLLTGKVPFQSDSLVDLMHRVCEAEPVPPTTVRPEIPKGLEAVCLACLKKKPSDRPTAQELASRLEALASHVGQTTTTLEPVRSRPRTMVWMAGFAATLLLVAVAWGLWSRNTDQMHEQPKDSDAMGSEVPVVPLPQKSLKIQPIKVSLSEPQNGEALNLGVLGKAIYGAKFGDAVTITVELSQPGYFYLIGCNFDGKEQLLWPTNRGEAPPKLERLRYPENDEDKLFLDEDGVDSGIQAYVVVASSSPLPAYTQRQSVRESKWSRLPAVAKVWQADLKATYPVTEAGVDRAKVMKLPGEPPLAALCRALAKGDEVAEAIAFGVLPKGEKR